MVTVEELTRMGFTVRQWYDNGYCCDVTDNRTGKVVSSWKLGGSLKEQFDVADGAIRETIKYIEDTYRFSEMQQVALGLEADGGRDILWTITLIKSKIDKRNGVLSNGLFYNPIALKRDGKVVIITDRISDLDDDFDGFCCGEIELDFEYSDDRIPYILYDGIQFESNNKKDIVIAVYRYIITKEKIK